MRSRDALLALTLSAFGAVANAGIDASDLHTIWPQRVSGQRLLLSATHKQARFGLFVVRFDSKASGDGFCGAGSEDYLVLARMGKTGARPLAAERIQSCLDVQSLLIDDGDDFDALVRHLQPDPALCAVSFEPLTDAKKPQRVSMYIDAARGRLVRGAPPDEANKTTCAAAQTATESMMGAAPPTTHAHR